jgi:hypothetical protein
MQVNDCVDTALTLALSLDRERDLEGQRGGQHFCQPPRVTYQLSGFR